ncbi:MAG: hypothetical protein KC731_04245, partial [Myxococcales bacterium]|nr:hypothetical protein [Myxococcales bacterium]
MTEESEAELTQPAPLATQARAELEKLGKLGLKVDYEVGWPIATCGWVATSLLVSQYLALEVAIRILPSSPALILVAAVLAIVFFATFFIVFSWIFRTYSMRSGRNVARILGASTRKKYVILAAPAPDLAALVAIFSQRRRLGPVVAEVAAQTLLIGGEDGPLVMEPNCIVLAGETLHPDAIVTLHVGDEIAIDGGRREQRPIPPWARLSGNYRDAEAT